MFYPNAWTGKVIHALDQALLYLHSAESRQVKRSQTFLNNTKARQSVMINGLSFICFIDTSAPQGYKILWGALAEEIQYIDARCLHRFLYVCEKVIQTIP